MRPRWTVPAGDLRVRVPYGALGTLSGDGHDGDSHHRLQLWPGAPGGVTVLKQHADPVAK